MKRLTGIALLIICLANTGFGQTVSDALRFSFTKPGGTARGLAIGGAAGAIGAEQTGISINPAGLGFYRRSEVMVTGDLVFSNSSTTLEGNKTNDGKVSFNLGNAGVVFTKLFEKNRRRTYTGKWKSVSFGIVFNRLANFNSYRSYDSPNTYNSILQDYKAEINNVGVMPANISPNNVSFGTLNAYQTYLLNPYPVNDSTSTVYTAVTDAYKVHQQMVVNTHGGVDELALSFGANYNDVFYFGGSIGFPILNYQEDVTVTETNNTSTASFKSFIEQRSTNVSGYGVNAKFGFIIRPNQFIRFGASIHSPTYYHLNDNYSYQTTSIFDSATHFNAQPGSFSYKLNSPFRAIGSAAVFFKKYGFFSLDYEYADYSRSKYFFDAAYASDQNSLNQSIQSNLRVTHTLRGGLEFALGKFRLRGGYAYTTSPIVKTQQLDNADYVSMTYSGGIGFRWKRVFLDMTYFRNTYNTASAFTPSVTATNSNKQDNVLLTFGFNF